MQIARVMTFLVAIATSNAVADDVPGTAPRDDDPVAPTDVRPAEAVKPEWSDAPDPIRATGIERPEEPTPADRARWIPRALLFVPRWVVWGVAQPARGAAYVYERYELRERVVDLLFDPERVFGIYPVATYETGFGLTAGAHLVHRDLFGAHEKLKLRSTFGGRFRQAHGVALRSGERFGDRVATELGIVYERRPHERFFGIGNGDEIALSPAPLPLIDPMTDDAAVATRFREQVARGAAVLDGRIAGNVHARLSGAISYRELASTTAVDSVEMHYRTDSLVGWNRPVHHTYLEAAIVYDSRRSAAYQSQALDSAGWLASLYGGRVRGFAGDTSAYLTYGGEVQRYFDLYDGSRVLVLRARLEGVVGGDEDQIAFVDLPQLGGTEYLRGYPAARFRDRVATLGTIEYTWDIGNYLAAYTFVDAGRVWRALADLGDADLRSMRVGAGGGIQLHTGTSFLTRLQLATSLDGDVFVELALSPAFGRRERARRD